MKAAVGDRVVVASSHTDVAAREGEVIEVAASDGSPPWRVRWTDDGHESLFCPGPDVYVERQVERFEVLLGE
ncbi:DUF1918 domain-containing protein [Occultella glacieicola]|uniref:DUF1918 domain-containing protein n=1 Tax=Occultella glacieicola TaxID=2518684 RepID=A0ABY2E981_9MICO|nr:DUF1918 domain-containing protein [Occultella glacieicola]TDE94852.1 DUF1918 domain-containing protein [Occultella glacieicola]